MKKEVKVNANGVRILERPQQEQPVTETGLLQKYRSKHPSDKAQYVRNVDYDNLWDRL